jgi:hypothetical protein
MIIVKNIRFGLTESKTIIQSKDGDKSRVALIIENAVPELERIANDILGQMSGGKNYLKFETQKELKSRSVWLKP